VGTFLAARLSLATLKWSLERERPLNIYSGHETFSFPSGHATTAMMVYGFLAFLLARGRPRHWRALLLSLAGVLIVAIGLSRLYLGMHWLSDVVAGFALGLAWITLLGAGLHYFHPQAMPSGRLALAALLTLLIAGAGMVQWRLPLTLQTYRGVIPGTPLHGAPAPPLVAPG
jgi:undecaprenyl-diphosphatase